MIGLLIIAVAVWGMICNRRTHRERVWLIQRAFGARDWPIRAAAFRAVSYEAHLAHRFFLLDAFKLYPPTLWDGQHKGGQPHGTTDNRTTGA